MAEEIPHRCRHRRTDGGGPGKPDPFGVAEGIVMSDTAAAMVAAPRANLDEGIKFSDQPRVKRIKTSLAEGIKFSDLNNDKASGLLSESFLIGDLLAARIKQVQLNEGIKLSDIPYGPKQRANVKAESFILTDRKRGDENTRTFDRIVISDTVSITVKNDPNWTEAIWFGDTVVGRRIRKEHIYDTFLFRGNRTRGIFGDTHLTERVLFSDTPTNIQQIGPPPDAFVMSDFVNRDHAAMLQEGIKFSDPIGQVQQINLDESIIFSETTKYVVLKKLTEGIIFSDTNKPTKQKNIRIGEGVKLSDLIITIQSASLQEGVKWSDTLKQKVRIPVTESVILSDTTKGGDPVFVNEGFKIGETLKTEPTEWHGLLCHSYQTETTSNVLATESFNTESGLVVKDLLGNVLTPYRSTYKIDYQGTQYNLKDVVGGSNFGSFSSNRLNFTVKSGTPYDLIHFLEEDVYATEQWVYIRTEELFTPEPWFINEVGDDFYYTYKETVTGTEYELDNHIPSVPNFGKIQIFATGFPSTALEWFIQFRQGTSGSFGRGYALVRLLDTTTVSPNQPVTAFGANQKRTIAISQDYSENSGSIKYKLLLKALSGKRIHTLLLATYKPENWHTEIGTIPTFQKTTNWLTPGFQTNTGWGNNGDGSYSTFGADDTPAFEINLSTLSNSIISGSFIYGIEVTFLRRYSASNLGSGDVLTGQYLKDNEGGVHAEYPTTLGQDSTARGRVHPWLRSTTTFERVTYGGVTDRWAPTGGGGPYTVQQLKAFGFRIQLLQEKHNHPFQEQPWVLDSITIKDIRVRLWY